jgi:hypothetical protein
VVGQNAQAAARKELFDGPSSHGDFGYPGDIERQNRDLRRRNSPAVASQLVSNCRTSSSTPTSRATRLQHIAFEYQTIDDLLGTYARIKGLGFLPVLAADQGLQMAFYYADPDQNSVELNVNNYGNEWTATEHIKTSPSFAARPMGAYVDPDKMIAARNAGASPWELHERAFAGEFVPLKAYDPRALL